jgi:hypothetical protein
MAPFSVIIPVFCEPAVINGTIEAIRGLKGGDTTETSGSRPGRTASSEGSW